MAELKIFAGNSNLELSKQIAEYVGVPLGEAKVSRFADGEVFVDIHDNVRGNDVFLIQSTCPPVNENYMELFILLDALKRASAARVTAVIPYYGYARQDRKASPRAPISAKCVADLISTAGASRIMAVDLHAGQIQGFFDVPFDHLYAMTTLAKAWKEKYGSGDEFIVVSPDAGGVERARAFAKRIDCSIAIIDKRRVKPNEAKALNIVGDVRGKTAIIVDDMIDTAGTLTQAVDSLLKNGAQKVASVATHAVFSGPALDRIYESELDTVMITNTIPLSEPAQKMGKFEVISMASLIGETIRRVHENKSVSSLFT